MRSGMPTRPLTIPAVIAPRAERLFRHRPVVARNAARTHRSSWGEVIDRSRRLAAVLAEAGIGQHDRVATFAWSGQPHVEAYFAVPSMGAVPHTINLRLPAEQVAYIVEHADDAIVLCDRGSLPAWRAVEERLGRPRKVIVLPDGSAAPAHAGSDYLDYEELLAAAAPMAEWAQVSEEAPAHLSYTTGTTGRPKGILFSHRSTVLQALSSGLADTRALSATDTLLPLVPLFLSQVGTPWSAALHGCGLVLPGDDLSPAAICDLIEQERPTVADGFGAALTGLLDHWRKTGADLSSLRRYVCGGSPVPRAVSRAFEEEVGVPIIQVYGMTETSGLASFNLLPAEAGEKPGEEARRYYATSQGRPAATVEMRLVDEAGDEVPWDGDSMGELQVKGPWVAVEYFRDRERPDSFSDGWLRTGDAARIDPMGYVRIMDRMKDLVRSSSGWISTVVLEEELSAHPSVSEVAVVGMPDEDAGERPWARRHPRTRKPGTTAGPSARSRAGDMVAEGHHLRRRTAAHYRRQGRQRRIAYPVRGRGPEGGITDVIHHYRSARNH